MTIEEIKLCRRVPVRSYHNASEAYSCKGREVTFLKNGQIKIEGEIPTTPEHACEILEGIR